MNWYKEAQRNPFEEDINNMDYFDISHYEYKAKDVSEIGLWFIDDAGDFFKNGIMSDKYNLDGGELDHSDWELCSKASNKGRILAAGRYAVSSSGQKTLVSCHFSTHKHYGDVGKNSKLSSNIFSMLHKKFTNPLIKI